MGHGNWWSAVGAIALLMPISGRAEAIPNIIKALGQAAGEYAIAQETVRSMNEDQGEKTGDP